MPVRSSPLLAAFAAAALTAAGCGGPGNAGKNQLADPNKAGDNAAVDVGAPLYPAKPEVKIAAAVRTGETLVVPNCTVQFEERQQVASEVDGTIDLLAVRDDTIAETDSNCVYHPRDVNRQVKYRRLKEGDTVAAKQVICLLDDQLVTTRMESAKKQEAATSEVMAAATEGVKYTLEKLNLSKDLLLKGGGSRGDVLQDQVTLTRFQENLAQASATIAKANADFKEAQVMLGKHKIRSNVNGVVRNTSKRAGEFVKAGEKLLEIQSLDVVRLEGNLDVQYATYVKRGMTVTVEPAVPSAPVRSHAPHRQEVTGIAVTLHPDRPLVASTGADGSAWLWDAVNNGATHHLPHPVPVRSVACSPPGAKAAVAVTGSDDGKLRVWDVANPDKLPTDCKELADAHAAAVGAVAFSPDGKFLATAAGRDVFVWDATEWKKLYALPAEHRDAVTGLQFTPQGTLVTASKDRSIKVWKLGGDRGAVAKTIDHRAGAVDVLGVTKDGGRVVFDQDKNRLDLIGLADKQTAGQIQNLGPTAVFSTLAVFSRDDAMLVTAGGEGELKGGLQVWTVPPAGGRGSEAARFFTPGRVGVTAAAFSPSAAHPFLVVGTEKGSVHLWKPPAAARTAYTGRVTNVDSTDPRYVTVRVEMDNKQLNLLDRSAATVIINPGQ